jgi:hypothetical protein
MVLGVIWERALLHGWSTTMIPTDKSSYSESMGYDTGK